MEYCLVKSFCICWKWLHTHLCTPSLDFTCVIHVCCSICSIQTSESRPVCAFPCSVTFVSATNGGQQARHMVLGGIENHPFSIFGRETLSALHWASSMGKCHYTKCQTGKVARPPLLTAEYQECVFNMPRLSVLSRSQQQQQFLGVINHLPFHCCTTHLACCPPLKARNTSPKMFVFIAIIMFIWGSC